MKCFAKRESKLPKNATINILYDFHDFLIPAYLHHVYCYLQHVDWHLDNPWPIIHSWELQIRSSGSAECAERLNNIQVVLSLIDIFTNTYNLSSNDIASRIFT